MQFPSASLIGSTLPGPVCTPSSTNASDYARDSGASQVWNNVGDKATVIAGTTPVATSTWGGVKLRYR